MKKTLLPLAACLSVFSLISCADNGNTGNQEGPAVSPDSISGSATTGMDNNTPNINTSNPITKEDSTFVVTAAGGGVTEIESANVAQKNAAHPRVKAFAQMMIQDHTAANQELKSFAGSKGMMLQDTLPADKRKMIEAMSRMQGRAFDRHYIDMMITDHQKTVDLFQKQSQSGGDPALRAMAEKTLPTLRMHLDSAQAIKRGL